MFKAVPFPFSEEKVTTNMSYAGSQTIFLGIFDEIFELHCIVFPILVNELPKSSWQNSPPAIQNHTNSFVISRTVPFVMVYCLTSWHETMYFRAFKAINMEWSALIPAMAWDTLKWRLFIKFLQKVSMFWEFCWQSLPGRWILSLSIGKEYWKNEIPNLNVNHKNLVQMFLPWISRMERCDKKNWKVLDISVIRCSF